MTTASTVSTLLLQQSGGVLSITLNRPEVRNAMSLAMVNELTQVLAQAEQDPSVRVVVLRGAGGHFCAGGDLQDMAKARMAPMAIAMPPSDMMLALTPW